MGFSQNSETANGCAFWGQRWRRRVGGAGTQGPRGGGSVAGGGGVRSRVRCRWRVPHGPAAPAARATSGTSGTGNGGAAVASRFRVTFSGQCQEAIVAGGLAWGGGWWLLAECSGGLVWRGGPGWRAVMLKSFRFVKSFRRIRVKVFTKGKMFETWDPPASRAPRVLGGGPCAAARSS